MRTAALLSVLVGMLAMGASAAEGSIVFYVSTPLSNSLDWRAAVLANCDSVNTQVNFTQQFSTQVGSFLSVAENNPYIQSITVIQDVITELEGTQNRIAASRIFYNDAVNDYNTAVRSFPNNIVAGSFGFQEATYFQE